MPIITRAIFDLLIQFISLIIIIEHITIEIMLRIFVFISSLPLYLSNHLQELQFSHVQLSQQLRIQLPYRHNN